MIQPISIFGFIFILTFPCFSQQVVYGNNNYIEYQTGTLPIVISVPHGGSLVPSDIPNRTCNNPTTVTDAFTIEMAAEIKKSLYAKTGCYPHIIICHLKRTKLDCNRNISEGACNNPVAEVAWNEFQNFIELARNKARQQFGEKVFYVDLHGHGNPIQRIELGYLLYDDELALSDSLLNTEKYINYSSISCLVRNNTSKATHAQLLRGPKSFGTFLAKEGFPAVPSEQIPFPGINTNYFRGGFNTANHTCFNQNISAQGVQIELNFNGVRDTPTNRAFFADKFSAVITEFLKTHTQSEISNCKPLSTDEHPDSQLTISPNPVSSGTNIMITGLISDNTTYLLTNYLGQVHHSGEVSNEETIELKPFLMPGLYFATFYDQTTKMTYQKKLIIESKY